MYKQNFMILVTELHSVRAKIFFENHCSRFKLNRGVKYYYPRVKCKLRKKNQDFRKRDCPTPAPPVGQEGTRLGFVPYQFSQRKALCPRRQDCCAAGQRTRIPFLILAFNLNPRLGRRGRRKRGDQDQREMKNWEWKGKRRRDSETRK